MSQKVVRFFDIEWDYDGDDEGLPSEFETSVDSKFDIGTDGADILSDEFGFCVASFDYEIIGESPETRH